MAPQTLDDLISAIQSSLIDAQNSITARLKQAGSHIRNADGTRADAETSRTVVSSSDSEYGDAGKHALQNAIFHERRSHRVSLLSLEFGCLLKKSHRSKGTDRYLVKIKNVKIRPEEKLHRMAIIFGGLNDFAGVVSLDGKILMEVPAYRFRSKPPAANRDRVSVWQRILKGFKIVRKEEGFIMTEMQTEQARKITEHSDSENQGTART